MTYEIDTVAKTIKLTSNVTFKEVRELEKMFPGFTLAPANGIQWGYPSYQPVFPENPTYVTGPIICEGTCVGTMLGAATSAN